MRSLKALHKWFAGVALLAIMGSFTGVPGAAVNFTKTQTELVLCPNDDRSSSVVYSRDLLRHASLQIIDRYTVFNFKCLLIGYEFHINVTFKTREKAVIRFKDLNSIPQQNLITRLHSTIPHDVL